MQERPPPDLNVDELREWLRPRLEKPGGIRCPVCAQHAQAYKRQVTGAMVRVMERMVEALDNPKLDDGIGLIEDTGEAWVHLADVQQETRDVATCQYWGLIREHTEQRGFWRVTVDGREFLSGRRKIEKYAHVYAGKVYAHTGPWVDVYEVAPGFKREEIESGNT